MIQHCTLAGIFACASSAMLNELGLHLKTSCQRRTHAPAHPLCASRRDPLTIGERIPDPTDKIVCNLHVRVCFGLPFRWRLCNIGKVIAAFASVQVRPAAFVPMGCLGCRPHSLLTPGFGIVLYENEHQKICSVIGIERQHQPCWQTAPSWRPAELLRHGGTRWKTRSFRVVNNTAPDRAHLSAAHSRRRRRPCPRRTGCRRHCPSGRPAASSVFVGPAHSFCPFIETCKGLSCWR